MADSVCHDPSVFAESFDTTTIRNQEIVERCELTKYGFGQSTTSLVAHTSIYGFVLYQFLLDDGIDAALARDAVLMMVAEPIEPAELKSLPSGGTPGTWHDAVLVRVGRDFVELPGRPKVRKEKGSSLQLEGASEWLEQTAKEEFPDEELSVAIVAHADTPADLVVEVMESLHVGSVQLLTRSAGGSLGAEELHLSGADEDLRHRLRVEEGYFVLEPSGTRGEVAGSVAALEEWAQTQAGPNPTRLAIAPSGLSAQSLVTLLETVRGPHCSPSVQAASNESTSRCHNVQAVLERE